MPIPQSAIDAITPAVGDLAEDVLKTALHYGLLAELRDRLTRAATELTALRDAKILPPVPVGGVDDYGANRLNGKIQGIHLALSYLDELTR